MFLSSLYAYNYTPSYSLIYFKLNLHIHSWIHAGLKSLTLAEFHTLQSLFDIGKKHLQITHVILLRTRLSGSRVL